MMSDPLAARLRNAVDAFPVPEFPRARIAERVASAAQPVHRRGRRPLAAIAGGAAVLVAALAVGVPTAEKLSPGFLATMKRLTGHDWSHVRTTTLPPMSLTEARRRTRFPIVVPRGKRVLDARPYPNDAGITLTVAVDVHAQAMVQERWAGAPPQKLDGIGVHDDGTIRRVSVHRWRIGDIEFSMPMWTLGYHRYAAEVERATREAMQTR